MMSAVSGLTFVRTLPLQHGGDCSILGIAPDFTLFVEEAYTADAWIAQHQITLEGDILQSVDEDFGQNPTVTPLQVPLECTAPQRGLHTQSLNFSGPRHRGVRDLERVAEMVRPLPIHARMRLAQHIGADVSPAFILGIAESYVLSEAQIARPHSYVVCRRVRVAYALPQPALDRHGSPYDYDTQVLYLAHLHQRGRDDDDLLAEAQDTLPTADLYRPMDCALRADFLFVADGGDETRRSAVHIWRVDHPPAVEDAEFDWKG